MYVSGRAFIYSFLGTVNSRWRSKTCTLITRINPSVNMFPNSPKKLEAGRDSWKKHFGLSTLDSSENSDMYSVHPKMSYFQSALPSDTPDPATGRRVHGNGNNGHRRRQLTEKARNQTQQAGGFFAGSATGLWAYRDQEFPWKTLFPTDLELCSLPCISFAASSAGMFQH